MQTLRGQEKNPIMEAINWVFASVQDNDDWVSEFPLILHETEFLGK